MDRCPFRPPAASVCRVVGAQHKLNGSCQCLAPGFDHREHEAACGTRWVSTATAAQIDALQVIAEQPGITLKAFEATRESRGLSFRQLRALGLIETPKDKPYQTGRAHLTNLGTAALAELARPLILA